MSEQKIAESTPSVAGKPDTTTPTPPAVQKTVEILKDAAAQSGAKPVDATVAAINVASQHHANLSSKSS